jgi:hypothetical protein
MYLPCRYPVGSFFLTNVFVVIITAIFLINPKYKIRVSRSRSEVSFKSGSRLRLWFLIKFDKSQGCTLRLRSAPAPLRLRSAPEPPKSRPTRSFFLLAC